MPSRTRRGAAITEIENASSVRSLESIFGHIKPLEQVGKAQTGEHKSEADVESRHEEVKAARADAPRGDAL